MRTISKDIANLRGCDYQTLPINSNSIEERWFLAIRPGHTPESSQIAKITAGWIEEWLAGQRQPLR